MGFSMRRTGVACGAVVASAAIALSGASASWGSSSALVVGGIGVPSMSDSLMSPLLGGALKGQQRVSVKWPAQAGPTTGKNDMTLGAAINVGKANLNTEIKAALSRLTRDANGNPVNGEKVTVVGLSAGSLVVDEVLRQMAADADAPGKNQITFVLVADSSRQDLLDKARYNRKHEYTYQPAPETKYDIVVVTGEYDGHADFPDRWWNALAVANAIAGTMFVHVPTMYSDLSEVPAKNITYDVNSLGGKTTHYLIPAEKLPLVQMFPKLASQEAELKAKIDAAYKRNDVVAVKPVAKVAPAPAVSAASVAVAAPAPARVAIAEAIAAPAVETDTVAAKRNDETTIVDDDVDATTDADTTTDADVEDDDDSIAADGEEPTESSPEAAESETESDTADSDQDAGDSGPSNDAEPSE